MLYYEEYARISVVRNNRRKLKKKTFSEVYRARNVTLKEEECYECELSVKIPCSKLVVHTNMSYFTKLGIYWDKEI